MELIQYVKFAAVGVCAYVSQTMLLLQVPPFLLVFVFVFLVSLVQLFEVT